MIVSTSKNTVRYELFLFESFSNVNDLLTYFPIYKTEIFFAQFNK